MFSLSFIICFETQRERERGENERFETEYSTRRSPQQNFVMCSPQVSLPFTRILSYYSHTFLLHHYFFVVFQFFLTTQNHFEVNKMTAPSQLTASGTLLVSFSLLLIYCGFIGRRIVYQD